MAIETQNIKKIVTYTFWCNKCHKTHEVDCNTDYVSNPDIEYIKCICGKNISVALLQYHYKHKNRKKFYTNNFEILK